MCNSSPSEQGDGARARLCKMLYKTKNNNNKKIIYLYKSSSPLGISKKNHHPLGCKAARPGEQLSIVIK